MIIRSQNKKELHNLDTIKMISVTTNSLKYFVEVNSQKVIGTYSTEEKAIKVLDMIEDAYMRCNREHIMGNFAFVQNKLFEMPQDSEV